MIRTKKKTALTIIIVAFFILALTAIFVYAASSYRINDASQTLINEHSVAKNVYNGCGKDMFVPTNTAAEWSSFRSNADSCVTLYLSCPSATGSGCTGTVLNSKSSPGGTWNDCKNWCEQLQTGTCCVSYGDFGDTKCELTDGSVSGSGSASGACT